MQYRQSPSFAWFASFTLAVACSATAMLAPTRAAAQARRGQEERPERRLRGVLGGVTLTAEDNVAKTIVERLDFDSYKELVRGLTQFGDREQGTERNARAVDWIEQQLRGWGYTPERLHYEYRPRRRGADGQIVEGAPEPRSEVYATKIGSSAPHEMYILGAHMDGRGGGEAANDDASGTALVLEIARVLASPDIRTERSVRFTLWNNEETGLQGSRAYVEQRAPLQGIEDPSGSGQYPEPTWLGMIQHDMMMWDHGNPVVWRQALDADVDIEFQLNSAKAAESAELGLALLNANRKFATDYPAALSNAMSNTDSAPFMDEVPAVSLRENRRLYETGNRANPHWHQPTDLFVTFSDEDFRLGFNAAQTTLGAVAKLIQARVVGPQ